MSEVTEAVDEDVEEVEEMTFEALEEVTVASEEHH